MSDASYGMPLYQALVIIATTISGGVFYNEFGAWAAEARASGEFGRVAGFVGGVLTLCTGMMMVASQGRGNCSGCGGTTTVSPVDVRSKMDSAATML